MDTLKGQIKRFLDEEKELLDEEKEILHRIYTRFLEDHAYLWEEFEDVGKLRHVLIVIIKLFYYEHKQLGDLSKIDQDKFNKAVRAFFSLKPYYSGLLDEKTAFIKEVENLGPERWFQAFDKDIQTINGIIEKYDHFKALGYLYSKGIPIQKREPSLDERWRIQEADSYRYVEGEFFKHLLNVDKHLSSQRKKIIASHALPFLRMRNILFHWTDIIRVPIIIRFGLLSYQAINKITMRYFKGYIPISSGWGAPYFGDNYIDVWDPTLGSYYIGTKIDEKSFRGKWISTWEEIESDIEHRFDPNINFVAGPNTTFAIKLTSQHMRTRLKRDLTYKRIVHNPGWSYIKYRVEREELVGLFLSDKAIKFFGEFLSHFKKRQRQPYSDEESLEVLGSNIEMPIYDKVGNLIWPEKIRVEELIKKFA